VGDPARAIAMQRYMKSEMPYHGCTLPVLREVCRDVFADVDLPDAAAWHSLVLAIWREAAYREERYAAIELTGDRRASSLHTPAYVSRSTWEPPTIASRPSGNRTHALWVPS
jgi:3-methyladenine DNA glycosylase AlkD